MITSILLSLLFGVLPMALIAGVIGAAIAAREARDEEPPSEPGIGTVRRLFIYVLALLGLVFTAVGVALLITGALQVALEQVIVSQRSEQLSTALAFALVGTPAWIVFAYLAQRSLAQHPVEARSHARRLYFVVARGVALVIVVANAITAGRQITGLDPFSSHGWGWLIAWAGVWVIHQWLASAEPAPSVVTRLLERLSWYFGAVIGLFLLLAGIAQVVRAPLRGAYDALTGTSLVDRGLSVGLREGLVVLVVGGAIWGWHWLRGMGARDRLTTLWHLQIFVFGTLPGVALTVIPVGILLYTTLEWFLGVPDVERASAQFIEVPGLLGALVAGVATWGYHRTVLLEATGGREEQTEPERVYRYLVTAAGLLAAAIGVASILALACEAIGGSGGALVRPAGWWQNRLLSGLTALVVGLPIWAVYWTSVQRIATRDVLARLSPSRRAFLFAAVGVSLIAVIVSLTVLLFQLFRAILDGTIALTTLRDARWSISVTATAAVIAVYYLLVLREDQAMPHAEPAAAAVRTRTVTLIAPDGSGAVVEALRAIEGVRVRTWERADLARAALSAAQLDALRDAVRASTTEQLVVVVSDGTFEVVPYREVRA